MGWRVFVRSQLKKWGNSSAVRIPASMMTLARLSPDQAVDLRVEEGKIIIEPIIRPTYDLDQLLALMTPDTFPEDVDFGPPQGGEVW
jgi:antitoxin MazE